MNNRQYAANLTRSTLDKYNLRDWKVRLNNNPDLPFLGRCDHSIKTIILNGYHVDIHGDAEVKCTILHEIAHAIVGPNHGHDEVWSQKAKEIGCDNTLPCSHLNIPAHVVDAIRSGANVEVEIEEETHVIRTPKFKVTQLKELCPTCGKTAIEKFSFKTLDKNTGDTIHLITLECFHIIKKVIPRGTPFELLMTNDWKPEIKNCKHIFPMNQLEAESLGLLINQCKKCKEFKLYPFQVIGAQFIETALAIQKGAGCFDDMGLGKTAQALAVIKFHDKLTPTLYVVKSAITFQWFKQIIRFIGPTHLPMIIKTGRDFIPPGLKSYIISYDLLRRLPSEKIEKLGIKCVILDECQAIKNPDSTRTKEVRKLVSNPECKVIPLSGTPWKNKGGEFFPVLNMLSPFKFHSHAAYMKTWVDFYETPDGKTKQGGIRNPKKFREYIKDLVIRREYDEVMDEFPAINRMKINIKLDDLAQETYDDAVSDFVAWYNEAVIGGVEEQLSGIALLGKMARMRHLVGLAKIPATVAFVEEFIEDTDKKLMIYTHHIDVAELLFNEVKKLCEVEGINAYYFNSKLTDGERFTLAEKFNADSRCIGIGSTLAIGEGVDFQTCSDSLLHERQWNPQNEEQATPGRHKRIGQKSKVINITLPEAEDTIEQYFDEINERKGNQFHVVMNNSERKSWTEDDFARQMAAKIVAKHKGKVKTSAALVKAVRF